MGLALEDIKSRKEDVCALLSKPFKNNEKEFRRLVSLHGIDATNENVFKFY